MIKKIKNEELEKFIEQPFFKIKAVNRDISKKTHLNLMFEFNDYKLISINDGKYTWLSFSTGCLRNCLFCSIRKESLPFKYINIKKFKKEIKKFKKSKKLFLVAPEPFIHPQFFDIMEICTKKFKEIECFGCAELLSDPIFCSKVKKSGITHIQLLLCSTKPKIHDTIVGRKGHHTLTIKAIKNLKKVNLKVYIYNILMHQNITHIIQDEKLLKSLKLPYVIVPLRKANMHDSEFNGLAPKLSDIKKVKDKLSCTIGFPNCIIKSDNIKNDLTDIMKFNLYFSTKDYELTEKCKHCKHIMECPGMLRGYIND